MPTALEEAIIQAHDCAAGLAGAALIMDLLRKGEDAALMMRDRSLTLEERSAALKEVRTGNNTLMLITVGQEVCGISA